MVRPHLVAVAALCCAVSLVKQQSYVQLPGVRRYRIYQAENVRCHVKVQGRVIHTKACSLAVRLGQKHGIFCCQGVKVLCLRTSLLSASCQAVHYCCAYRTYRISILSERTRIRMIRVCVTRKIKHRPWAPGKNFRAQFLPRQGWGAHTKKDDSSGRDENISTRY